MTQNICPMNFTKDGLNKQKQKKFILATSGRKKKKKKIK